MGPWQGDELPDVDGVDHAPDQVIRRREFEAAGWRIWEDSHGMWHGERGDTRPEPMFALRFLLDELGKLPHSTEIS